METLPFFLSLNVDVWQPLGWELTQEFSHQLFLVVLEILGLLLGILIDLAEVCLGLYCSHVFG